MNRALPLLAGFYCLLLAFAARCDAQGDEDPFTNGLAPQNLALAAHGTTITGSNGGGWVNLIDGQTNDPADYGYTLWRPRRAPGYMQLDLGGVYSITGMKLLLYYGDSRSQKFKVEACTDPTPWTMAWNCTKGRYTGWQTITFTTPVQAQYLKLTGTFNSTDGAFYAVEWEVYGTADGVNATSQSALDPGGNVRPGRADKGTPKQVDASYLEIGGDAADESVLPTVVLTSDDKTTGTNGWAAVDGDPATVWVGRPNAGGWWLALTYEPALALTNLGFDLAPASVTNVIALYSRDATHWLDLPPPPWTHALDLKYLWLIFPDDGSGAVPAVREIHVDEGNL